MMFLMDEPLITKMFDLYEKVVAVNPRGYSAILDGVVDSTQVVKERELDRWTIEQETMPKSFEL